MDNIIGVDALYEAMCRCKCGVMWKASVASFCLNGLENVSKLSRQLKDGTYQPRPPITFTITSPKRREISSIAFRDRVYQRSLNDNAVYPLMSRSFIYDNYACQKNKGTDKARERLKTFLWRHYQKYGTEGYVAQFDISGYYPTMSHAVAERTFREKLPPEIYDMAERILHEQYDGDRGYNAGSQLIQIAGISILDKLDHYIKEQLHAKLYIRYMDDFLIISDDREYLVECMELIKKQISLLDYEINERKTRIYPLSESIEFLGFIFRLTDTGKVLMSILPKRVKQERKKLRRLVARSKRGLMPREKVDESYAAWRNHASKGNSFRLLTRMDKYYRELWGYTDANP